MRHAQLMHGKQRLTTQPVKETLHGNREATAVSQGTALLKKATDIEISTTSASSGEMVFNQNNLTSAHDFDVQLESGVVEFGQSMLSPGRPSSYAGSQFSPIPPATSRSSSGPSPASRTQSAR